ncbi:MAG: type VII toxin-antitoxin system MntA family adenylyltransferase antitoxin [Burkholderiales bacterium]
MHINEPQTAMDRLRQVFAETSELAFAVLIGSRANQSAREGSDWDIVVLWNLADRSADIPSPTRASSSLSRFGRHEVLRSRLAQCLNVDDEKIDLIDLSSARLAMKAVVVEEGIVVYLKDDLAWAHFQTATWRELEDHYWDRAHAA